jgi:class 3 adenylate cyclase/pimeloyl-ACP methyl ester carboxylesterase
VKLEFGVLKTSALEASSKRAQSEHCEALAMTTAQARDGTDQAPLAEPQRRLAAILAADIAGYSALMGADERATIRDLRSHQAVILPMVIGFGGKIIDTAGDGILAEFPSIWNAFHCAEQIQKTMASRQENTPSDRKMLFRIGINQGDIFSDGSLIYGDGVNVAARLQTLSEPGGICVSAGVRESLDGKMNADLVDLGEHLLKNIARPVRAYAVSKNSSRPAAKMRQTIQYCAARDGIRLAYAIVGKGPKLVKAANWLNHLEYDWETPLFRQVFSRLTSNFQLLRYDARGNGLSEWDIEQISFDTWVADLHTIVEASGFERFPLFGISQGCSVAIAYALQHPERVSCLILYGGFALGRFKQAKSQSELETFHAMLTFIKNGWGSDNPVARNLFTTQFMPGASRQSIDAFNDIQRKATSAECAARYFETAGNLDIRQMLPDVRHPTLVLHCREDNAVPFQLGVELAGAIPGARFIGLLGRNHMPQDGDPCIEPLVTALKEFVAEHPAE